MVDSRPAGVLIYCSFIGLVLGTLVLLPQMAEAGRRMPDPTFNYEKSGTDWPEPCPSGHAQSPVNVVKANVKTGEEVSEFYIEYEKSTPVSLSNHVAIELKPKNGSNNFLYTPEGKFRLVQLHLHAYSEHTLDGVIFPLELHFVHKQEGGSKLSVVAILFALHPEDKDNHFIERLVTDIPMNREEERSFETNLEEMFNMLVTQEDEHTPAPLDYYTYHGSLTIPPCSEQVTWYIRQHHATVSVRQWLAVLAGNGAVWGEQLTARPVRPLDGRVISKHAVIPKNSHY